MTDLWVYWVPSLELLPRYTSGWEEACDRALRKGDKPDGNNGVLFSYAALSFFATISTPSVNLWRPTDCCGTFTGFDSHGFTRPGGEAKCPICDEPPPVRSWANWQPPTSPRYDFPSILEDWLEYSDLNPLETALIMPNLVKRVERVFRNKILAPQDGERASDSFLRVIRGSCGEV